MFARINNLDLNLVCPALPMSLHCPFLIGPSVFSNIYPSVLENIKYENVDIKSSAQDTSLE